MLTHSYENNVKELQEQIELYKVVLKNIRDLILNIGESLKIHFVII